jgi:hypothetical protein
MKIVVQLLEGKGVEMTRNLLISAGRDADIGNRKRISMIQRVAILH